MKKKILAMILVMALAVILIPAVAQAATRAVYTPELFEQAVADSVSGDIIELTADITLNKNTDSPAISLSGKSITIDVGSFTLSIVNTGGPALKVGSGGAVDIAQAPAGAFNVTGTAFGVGAFDGGRATVTNATATAKIIQAEDDASGAYANGSNSTVTVSGMAKAMEGTGAAAADGGSVTAGSTLGLFGAIALDADSKILVQGNVKGERLGVGALDGGSVTVNGNVTSDENGVTAINSNITVKGNVGSGYIGVMAYEGGTVTVDGNLSGVESGVEIGESGGIVTVNGIISSPGTYIKINYSHGSVDFVPGGGQIGTNGDAGYMVFAHASFPGCKARVKRPVACKITGGSLDGIEYYALVDALDAAMNASDPAVTIQLLRNIQHKAGISISNKTIIFNVGTYDLEVENSAGHALDVGAGGLVSFVKTTGAFKVRSTGSGYAGVRATNGGKALVSDAIATGVGGMGALSLGAGSEVTVTSLAQGMSAGAVATEGGKVTVDCAVGTGVNSGGLVSSGAGSIAAAGSAKSTGENGAGISVNGAGSLATAESVTASGTDGKGVTASNSGSVTVGSAGTPGSVATTGAGGLGVDTYGDGSTVVVYGHVQSTYRGIETEGGSVTVTGDVTATGAGSHGVNVKGGSVTVTGNVTATEGDGVHEWGGGSVTVYGDVLGGKYGVFSNYGGIITVTGDVSAASASGTGVAVYIGMVTVDGAIISPHIYIAMGMGLAYQKGPDDGEAGTGDDAGYWVFGDPANPEYQNAKVRVKMAEGTKVCEILGGDQYTSLDAALDDAVSGDTIRLLLPVTHRSGLIISGRSITFDVGAYSLNLINTEGTALTVTNQGEVKLASTTGAFHVTGSLIGVAADSGGKAAVTSAAATGASGIGAVASGTGSEIKVLGLTQGVSCGAEASAGGAVTAGSVAATGENSVGVRVRDSGTVVTVKGDIDAAAGYIAIGNALKTDRQGQPGSGDDAGYLIYTDPSEPGAKVRVKAPVCEIVSGKQYSSLIGALDDAVDGDTIRLLADIDHRDSITVAGIKLIFDVGAFELKVNATGAALSVSDYGEVALYADGGALKVTGTETGVFAGSGGKASVTKATGTLYGAYAWDGGRIVAGSATGTGEGSYGAYTYGAGSEVTVTGLAQGSSLGAFARDGGKVSAGSATSGDVAAWANGANSVVTVAGVAQGSSCGAYAMGGGRVEAGSATATAIASSGAHATGKDIHGTGSRITVTGLAQGVDIGAFAADGGSVTAGSARGSTGANAYGTGSTVMVNGNAQGLRWGARAQDGGSVTVSGDVYGKGTDDYEGIGASALGAGSTVTVDGTITAAVYISIDWQARTFPQGQAGSGEDAGYLVYTGTQSSAKVRVKTPAGPAVCEIVGKGQYYRLIDALNEASDGDVIRLLTSINFTNEISINNMELTFDVGAFELNVNSNCTGLCVTNGGEVKLAGTTGAFNVTGTDYGVFAESGGQATVTKATATGERGKGAYARGGSSVEADSVTATGPLSYGACAVGAGSRVEVNGDAQGTWAGARAEDGGSVKAGSVMAMGPGSHGASTGGTDSSVTVVGNAQGVTCGAYASGTGSSVVVSGNVQGESIGAFASGTGCTIKVDGDVTATSGAGSGMGVSADEGSTIIVGGHVQGVNTGIFAARGGSATAYSARATGENGTGAWAGPGGTVTVRGDVQATGADSVGAAAVGTGSLITVEGAIVAADTYIMIGGKDTGVKKSPYPADGSLGAGANLGYLVYDDVNQAGMVRVKVKITGLPANLTMLTGGQVTWDPQPGGGAWHWDPDFFSASFNSPATFTAKKAGRSTISYTVSGLTQEINVTVQALVSTGTGQDALPEEVVPATGQDVTPGMLLLMLAACMGAAAAAVDMGRRRKARDDAE